jgi:hypothetical protein
VSTPRPPQFVDPANPLLSQVTARLDAGTVSTPDGSRVYVLTIRTASTTLTVFLSADDLHAWAGILTSLTASGGFGLHIPSIAESAAFGRGNGRPGGG